MALLRIWLVMGKERLYHGGESTSKNTVTMLQTPNQLQATARGDYCTEPPYPGWEDAIGMNSRPCLPSFGVSLGRSPEAPSPPMGREGWGEGDLDRQKLFSYYGFEQAPWVLDYD